jgi:hypothetical protein
MSSASLFDSHGFLQARRATVVGADAPHLQALALAHVYK